MRSLVESLRERLGDPDARSFQLAGEGLARLPAADLEMAAAAYRACLDETVPAELREAFGVEQADAARVAHAWVSRYNRNVHARLAGYLALGRLLRFEYPWPVVAMLGIGQVQQGFFRNRAFGLVGRALARLGSDFLQRATDGIDDVLRRTNRGIFADSVPTVLYALRCHDLRCSGRDALAQALLDGPLPPAMDDESRELARCLVAALALADGAARFEALAALTLRHFDREQAVFSHHLGGPRRSERPSPTLARRLLEPQRIAAPAIVGPAARRRLVYAPFDLPGGFDMRDHRARVEVFGRAFVSSVVGSVADYELAVQYVAGKGTCVAYPSGGSPATEAWRLDL